MTKLRLGLAFVGFVLALVGVLLEDRWVLWAAIAALALSFLIRLYLKRRGAQSQ